MAEAPALAIENSGAAAPSGDPGPRWHEPLQRYLRTLWTLEPALRYTRQPPFIVGRAIHLPAERRDDGSWHWYRAAAAHAAAHLALSPPAFDGRGLPPISRALLALLEDARVEALACRELPGLRRLWAPLHTAAPVDGDGFESLMLRLARSLLDPGYDDPHPWVRKGRRLFFVDASVQVLALRRPDELRHAASLLGHDIGQMRLPFNARNHAPGPDYRDDSRWMWPAGQAPQSEAVTPRFSDGESGGAGDGLPTAAARAAASHYPEWDRLISRLRRDWCAVFEEDVGPGEQPAAEDGGIGRRLEQVLRRRARREPSRPLRPEGDALDIDALVRMRIAQRQRLPPEAGIWRRAAADRRAGRLMMIIDQSASSAAPWGRSGFDRLQAARRVAALLAAALKRPVEVAIVGFSSSGRREVVVRGVKGFEEAFGPPVLDRLAALRSAHSTRLGAAIRHAHFRLCAHRPGGARQLLVISDGEPYDIDVHDSRYLVADARHAVRSAARQGIRVHCIVLDRAGLAAARQVFGGRRVGVLDAMAGLPGLMARLEL